MRDFRSPDEAQRNPGLLAAPHSASLHAGYEQAAEFCSPDEAQRNPSTLTHSPDYAAIKDRRSIRATITTEARAWIGTPYRHQGSLKGVGCDCLGLLIGVWREVFQNGGRDAAPPSALAIPSYTPDWAEAQGRETLAEGLRKHLREIDPATAREGDVVLFRWRAHLPAKHAGILVAPGRMVHAQEKAAVSEVALSGWWRRRMAYGFEFEGLGAAAPSRSRQ